MHSLERLVCSALLLGSLAFSSASAQEEPAGKPTDKTAEPSSDSPKVIMRDDPQLTASTVYYTPKVERKYDIPTPDPNIKIKEMKYTGNSRGRTEVLAIC